MSKEDLTVIEKMEMDLKEIRKALKRLEEIGFSEELMEIYIYRKTNVNLKEVRSVLSSQKEFLEQAFAPAE